MHVSDDLFELIKSLSMSEKRYFKIYASRHVKGGQNKYVNLFDSIAEMDEYDEAELKKSFSGQRFLNQFSVIKNYLYCMILEALRSFNSESVSVRLHELSRDIEILYEKGLISQCYKSILRAKQLARKHEKYSLLLDVMDREREIVLETEKSSSNYTQYLIDLSEEKTIALSRLQNTEQYRILKDRVCTDQLKQEGIPSNFAFMDHPLLASIDSALTFRAKVLFLQTQIHHYGEIKDYQKPALYRKKLIALFESHPEQMESHPRQYMLALHDTIIGHLKLKQKDEALEYIDRLKKIKVKSNSLKALLDTLLTSLTNFNY